MKHTSGKKLLLLFHVLFVLAHVAQGQLLDVLELDAFRFIFEIMANLLCGWLGWTCFEDPPPPPNPAVLVLDDSGTVGRQTTSLALDKNGRFVVGYYDSENDDLKILLCGNANCSQNVIESPDTVGDVGSYLSLALDKDDIPVVSYVDKSNETLKILRCGDTTCSNTTAHSIETPDPEEGDVRFTSLVLDANDYPVVSYYYYDKEYLKILRCGDTTCSNTTANSIEIPDTDGDVGGFNSLALDGSGYPVVSYYDYDNEALKILHCTDATCSNTTAHSIETPDTNGDVGLYTSLALDGSGYPVVSYYDYINEDLKILHCGDANCSDSATNTIETPDREGDVGDTTSLALNSKGHPVVSYYDVTNGDLKILRCGDAICFENNEIQTAEYNEDDVGEYSSLALDSNDNPIISYIEYIDADNKNLKLLYYP